MYSSSEGEAGGSDSVLAWEERVLAGSHLRLVT